MGLTGVRAGWITAPEAAAGPSMAEVGAASGAAGCLPEQQQAHGLHRRLLSCMQALAPSWVLSAEGVALLAHWHAPATQQWLADALLHLRDWRATQVRGLRERGWRPRPSATAFMLAEAPQAWRGHLAGLGARLRDQGIKWRECDSFGLPGHVRLRVHDRQAQAAFFAALDAAAATMNLSVQPMMPAMRHQPVSAA
jgi:hypothetical protein